MLSDNDIREILRPPRTIAVVGLSANPNRASYHVAHFLQQQGHRIIPVNPILTAPILGENVYARLRDVAVPVDIVDIFRRPEYVPDIVADAIEIGARVVWMQLGIIHTEAAAQAQAAGLAVVMDKCTLIEYRRLIAS
jgi:Predicted CoA-binding protein